MDVSHTNRVLIVGEAPGRHSGGLTRTRVSEFSGRPWEDWADWVNLLDEWPGSGHGKGSAWNATAARRAAASIDFSGYDAVILLGRRVAGVIIAGGAGFPFFRWTERSGTPVAVIPHTSGIVRFWNDPENVAAARRFLAELAATHARTRTETEMPKTIKNVSGRAAVIAAFRAAEKPLTPNEAAAIVIAAPVEVDAKGTTPMEYRLAAPIYRSAKKGELFQRVGKSSPARFKLRKDAPESAPELVDALRTQIEKTKATA